MWQGVQWLVGILGIFFYSQVYGLEPVALPTSSITESPFMQFGTESDRTIIPYVALGMEEEDSLERSFWHEHSYESLQQENKSTQQWSGLKVRLRDMFHLSIDSKERKVHSAFSLAPKTNVKLRANFKEIRAELRYQF
jgi:hypothetical protein